MGVYISLLLLVMITLLMHEKIFYLNDSGITISDQKFSKYKKISMLILITILGAFSAARDGIGIDYSSYLIHIENISFGYDNYMESGFQFLVKIIMSYFEDPRSVIIVMSILTVYFFISSIYSQSKIITMSVFLFLTWGYYFLTFNTIRNYFALALIVFAIKFILDKKYIKFIIMVVLASLFHKSALICLPLYFFANRKFTKQTYIFIFLGAAFLFLLKDQLRELAFWFYPHYEGSVYDSGRISVLNVLKSFLVLIYGFIYYKLIKDDNKILFYFNLNTIALIIYTAFYWIPEISRIGFYFNIAAIIFIPNLTSLIKSKDRMLINGIIYITSLFLFVLLMRGFYSPTIQLLPYETWIFQ